MADCTPIGDINAAEKNNFNQPGQTSQDPMAVNPEQEAQQQRLEIARQMLVDDTAKAAAGTAPSPEVPTPGEARNMRATAKWIVDLVNKNDNYRQKRADELDAAMRRASGMTVGQVGWWLRACNWIDKKFKNERADANLYFNQYMFMPGHEPYAQPMVQKFQAMRNLIRGQLNDFGRRHKQLLQSLYPIAKRECRNPKDLWKAMGIIANCEHVPEANAYLLNVTWPRRMQQLRNRIGEIVNNPRKSKNTRERRDLERELQELEDAHDMLSENLENPEKPVGLRSAGYTNAQARAIKAQTMKQFGIRPEEAAEFCRKLTEEYNYIVTKCAENGLIATEQLRDFPNFKHYVALMSDADNATGPVNDINQYSHMGSWHRRMGLEHDPAPATLTLSSMADRAATAIGMQDFGTELYAQRLRYGDKALETLGLESHSYDELIAWKHSGYEAYQSRANNILNAGGICVEVPVKDPKTGKTDFKRMYMWFKSDWRGSGNLSHITGQMLNDAITSQYRVASKSLELAGKATSLHGQQFTRFSLVFPFIGGTRDGVERMVHMGNRAYFTDDGKKLKNGALIHGYLNNTFRAARIMGDGLLHDGANLSPEMRVYWEAFKRQGLDQAVTPGVHMDSRPLAESFAKSFRIGDKVKDLAFLDRWKQSLGQYGEAALNRVDQWNNWWQNTPAFAQFMTLMEQGCSENKAGAYTRELMDMSQKGSLTPLLRVLSPFVVPTVQSAAAMARTLGLTTNAKSVGDIFKAGKKGWLGLMAGYAAFSVLYNFCRDTLGEDDAGNNIWDSMSVRDHTSALLIGIGEKGSGMMAKVPMPFGPARLAAVIADCTDRISRGLMNMEDMAGEVIFSVAKDVVPATNPQFNFSQDPSAFIMQMLTPDLLKPILEVYGNTNYFGADIARKQRGDGAWSDQGRPSTDPFWHKTARWAANNFGFTDVAPEHWRHLVQSYTAGPIRGIGEVFAAINGQSPTANRYDPDGFDQLQPWLRLFGGTMLFGRKDNVSRGLYFDYKRDMDNKIQRAGLKLTNSANQGKPEAARKYRRDVLEGSGLFTQEEIDDYELALAVSNELSKITQNFNKQYGKWWDTVDDPDQLREAFRIMDEQKNVLYDNFTNNAAYFQSRR